MRLPAELNPRVETVELPLGTPIYKITLTFNESDHVYHATEMTDFAALNILLQAMEDGYGEIWTPVQETPPAEPEPVEEVNE